MAKDIQSWAEIRETSIEIAEAIFIIADNDDAMAQKIWEEGSER